MADGLLAFVRSAIVPGATVHTDGWRRYATRAAGYKHEVNVHAGSEPAHVVLPRVHRSPRS